MTVCWTGVYYFVTILSSETKTQMTAKAVTRVNDEN
jgi:hypothetical protein